MPKLGLMILLLPGLLAAGQWPQFRGPQGNGIAETSALPEAFGPRTNLVWKTAIPAGYSSPVLTERLAYLTGYDEEKIYVLAVRRDNGEKIWQREVPRDRREGHHRQHGPASTSPVTDGENVYAFFGDFGLISYAADGSERWRLPLGPFENLHGHGSSPILAEGKVVLAIDQNRESFAMAVDKDSGSVVWRADRPEVTRGYATAGVFRPQGGAAQLVVPGAYHVIAYDLATGEKLWWVSRMSWQMKSAPAIIGDTIYINGWDGEGGDQGKQVATESWPDALAAHDADKDGKLSQQEVPDDLLRKRWAWVEHDLDADGFMGARDWFFYAARRAPVNNLVAIRPGNRRGDLTETDAVLWRHYRTLPNTPSPLVIDDVVYTVKDGGIVQSLDAATGEILKVGRLPSEAIDRYWASPIYGDGKIFLVSEACAVSIVSPGAEWETVRVNLLEDKCVATPAIADGRLFVRTEAALYSFGKL